MINISFYTQRTIYTGAATFTPDTTFVSSVITEEEAVRVVAELQMQLGAKQRELEQALESEPK